MKKTIKSLLNSFGLQLSKKQFIKSPLLHHEIGVLLDVGANVGQFALMKREEGYSNKIISFEPLPDAHATLLDKSSKDQLWTIHERCAIGSSAGETVINISKNSYSSSILAMNESHSNAAPESVYIDKATTKIITLDSIFDQYCAPNENVYLKIDTQGFENEVLSGVKDNLKNIKLVQLELSIVELYENQMLYKYFLDFFETNGFELWKLIPGFSNKTTGQMLQFDGIFVRKT